MKTKPVIIVPRPFMGAENEKVKEVAKTIFWLYVLKSGTIQAKKAGYTEQEKEKAQLLKLIPPLFSWSQNLLKPSEYVWLQLVAILNKKRYEPKAIHNIKAFLFSTYAPFIEPTDDEEIPSFAVKLTYLEIFVFYVLKTKNEVVLYFSKDGEASLCPGYDGEESRRNDWIGLSLSQILQGNPSVTIQPALSLFTKVDKAEIELLKAARNKEIKEFTVQKPASTQSYKWDLSTVEQGVGTAKEIHELTHQSLSGFGEFKITGNGKGNRFPYKRTVRTRFN